MGRIKVLYVCFILMSFAGCSGPKNTKDAKDEQIEKRVESLLTKMTLEEKIGQMNQVSFSGNIEEVSRLIKNGEVGSILNEVDPERVNALQRVAIEESRLGIPILIGRDVIHGFKTIFPIPLGQAASFNPQIVEKGARVSAVEASSVGVRWTFTPMIDISRDPRWGRIAESCGEDPYLTSVMGAAMVKGFQGDSLNNPNSIAACAKHFVGYGAAEGGRDYNTTCITERQLRNVYLPPFEAAVKQGVATFMTSFNANDGIPSSGNPFILKKVLRDEWGFDGFVVSDWASIIEMVAHGFCTDDKDAAMKAVNAGVDMEMVSYTYMNHLKDLKNENKVSEETIDNAVRNILRVKFRLGLFDNPYVDEKAPSPIYSKENLAIAKEAAIQSAILLKNDKQILPINESVKTIAVVGPMADAPYEQMGTWAFDGEKSMTQTPLMALRQFYGDKVNFIFEPGLAYTRDKNTSGISKAVSAANRADLVLAFVGEEAILSGEAHCLANLNLQGAQSDLINALAKTGKPIVTVVIAGRPLTIGKEAELSKAVLYSFHPGTMGGPAIADLLFGKAVPSGKTPVTFPKEVGQIPIYYSHYNTGRPANRNEILLDNIAVGAGQTSLGNTSFYLDAGFDPLYPFGFGLSYTTFEYSNLKLSSNELSAKDELTVTFDLKNTGNYEGAEVAQLYVRDMVGSVVRPVKELKRFNRITLKPGETRNVSMTFPVEELAFWNIDMKKVVEPGVFKLWVGTNSQEGISAGFKVKN
uniref:beta-glucosidase n=2 Tax=environmental samples TaxID=48479 RepID=G9IS35_9BACT|nr:GHF3 protein [uncultured bacterium D1_14]AEW47958.1 GHF3 protein [uncultured bacterium E2_1]